MIAITGGIAEGKSTVLEVLRKEGLCVLSADEVVHNLWQEPETLAELGKVFDLAEPTKEAITLKILGDSEERHRLNAFFHPLVHARILASGADAAEIPLLIEVCMQGAFERIWVVTCGREEQLRRLSMRVGEERARELIALQLPTRVKKCFADEVVRTIGTLEHVHTATRIALNRHMTFKSRG